MLVDRRWVGLSLLGLVAGLAPSCACAASRRRGCSLTLSGPEPELPTALASCGVPALDNICRTESAQLNALFGVTPEFAFFDDAGAPNAFAVQAENRKPSAVLFGVNLIRSLEHLGANGDPLAIVGIMAHEWAHILQYDKKVNADWAVRYELGADYMAGWYLAKTRSSDPQLLSRVATLFESLGDTSFTDADHHGTPRQRSKVMLAGAYAFRLDDGRAPDSASAGALDSTAVDALNSSIRIIR